MQAGQTCLLIFDPATHVTTGMDFAASDQSMSLALGFTTDIADL
jgi:hypothetical protein